MPLDRISLESLLHLSRTFCTSYSAGFDVVVSYVIPNNLIASLLLYGSQHVVTCHTNVPVVKYLRSVAGRDGLNLVRTTVSLSTAGQGYTSGRANR